jgi:signal transduction histidine kinase
MNATLIKRLPAWVIYLIVVSPIIATYRMLPNALSYNLVYDLIAAASLVAILIGVRVNKPQHRLPWYLLAVGVGLWIVGDIGWTYLEFVLHSTPFPSIADAAYLPAYGFFASGIYLIVRRHAPKGDPSLLIDALIFTTAVGVLAWMFLMAPYAQDQHLSLAQKLVSIAYPLGDVLILAVLVRVFLGARGWSTTYILLACGLGLAIASDSVYGLMLLEGTYYPGHVVDFGWLLFYTLWGVAALHPSMAARVDPSARPRQVVTRARLCLMAVAGLLLPALAFFQRANDHPSQLMVIRGAAVVIFLLIILRMGGIVGRLESANAQVGRMEREKGKLLDRTMEIGEEERVRVANELHDGPIHQLSAVAYRFEAGLLQLQRGNHEEAETALKKVRDSFGQEIDTLREMMQGLRPPEPTEGGLETALRDQLAAFQVSSGIHASLEMRTDRELPKEIETGVFRVTQEALANVAKHSAGYNVVVKLRSDDQATELAVSDDGIGFDLSAIASDLAVGQFGLIAMRQHIEALGGTFTVTSSDAGTSIMARFGASPATRPSPDSLLVTQS